jgi:hypothetical protein
MVFMSRICSTSYSEESWMTGGGWEGGMCESAGAGLRREA